MERVLLKFAIVRALIYGFAIGALCSCEELDKKLQDDSFDVTCYSGDTIIFHGYATRVYVSGTTWGMWEVNTKKSIRVTGNCVVIRE
jgi:hypothetical protein